MSRKLRHRSHHGVHAGEAVEQMGNESTHDEELEVLAYTYWQERGEPFGSPEEDWFRAEAELERQHEAAARL